MRARVYVSSTQSDLAEYRLAVAAALRQLGHEVVSMEDYTAAGRPPLDKCLADVCEADIYMGIFAWRYGSCPPECDESFTELEFRAAERESKECLLFLLADDAPWPPGLVDEDRSRISTLRSELCDKYLASFFRTKEDLATAVSVAVTRACEALSPTSGIPAETARLPPEQVDQETLAFYRRQLGIITDSLEADIRFYSRLGAGLLGAALLAAAASWFFPQNLEQLIGLGAGAVAAAGAVYPFNSLRVQKKLKNLLEGYRVELEAETPAPAAIPQVRAFLEGQLQGVSA